MEIVQLAYFPDLDEKKADASHVEAPAFVHEEMTVEEPKTTMKAEKKTVERKAAGKTTVKKVVRK